MLCPGQGAQRVGMGQDLAQRFEDARAVFEAMDEALGVALSTLMWEGPEDALTLTHNAQPAILAHSLAVYAVVGHALDPVAAAGHSLGEYSAYAAAGALAPVDAARLARRRGELMYEAGQQRPGAMAAVLGLALDQVADVCAAHCGNGRTVVVANINAPDQTVISGDPDAVSRAGDQLKALGAKRVLPLKVSGAFHSPLMEPAALGLRTELDRVPMRDPAFPVIANATAEPVTTAATARRLLGQQLTAPVQWVATMQRAAADAGGAVFVELGPGTVLSGLARRSVSAETISLGTAQQVADFLGRHP